MHANHRNSQHASRPAHHGRDGRTSRLRYKHLAFGVGLALGSLLVCGTAVAASGVSAGQSPTGGKVVGGVGSIVQNGAETVIKQQSKLLALDWQTFNVGKDATVLFKQPGVSAIALNRILDQNPSQIFGKINSNGQIFLINTHGIIFGASAQLNVGGLVASTLDLTPDDFLKQHFNLDAHGGHAGVVNHGTIAAASGGSVSLIGGNVQNSGLIVADYGRINLDGADKAVLDFDGNGLINVQITGALQRRFDTEQSAVANQGTLQSASGTVVLQASAAKDLFTNLVNNAGVIDAHGISTDGGVVRLVGSGGNAVSSGRIDASGVHGGDVQVLSDHNVGITGGRVDASGRDGGGSIRVGGGWQGGEGLQTAAATYVAPDATLTADAVQRGNGGSVVVWGDRVNNFYGSISARGGALGGDGGRVETSSHDGLNAQGRVDASAAQGKAGMWLLDPRNVDIITGGGGSLAGTAPTLYYSAATNNSTIDPTVIDGALTGGTNVSIFTGTGGSQNGDITVTDAITAAGAGSLYLKAAGSILLNADISGKDVSNPLNVYLWANYGGAATDLAYSSLKACTSCVVTLGDTANAAITTFGGAVDIRTGDATNAGGAVNIGNGTFAGTLDTSGTVAGALDVDANGITQLATAGSSITAGAATLKGGTGAISLTNSGNDFSGAVSLAGGTTQITDSNDLTLGTLATGALTAISGSGALSLSGNGSINGVLTAQAVTSITVDGSLTGLTGVAFSGTSPVGTGSLAGSGAITGLGSTAFNLTGTTAGTAGGIGFSGFNAADTTTVTGASGFDYAAKVSEGMAFAAATSVTGTGAITNLGSTAFNLTGNQAGTAGSIGFSGFDAADTTTVTGASGFDISSKSGEGMTFANATSVSGTGTTATITGSGQTYTLDSGTADKGSGNGVTWTSFGNIDDASGTIHFGTNGSLSGNVTAATLDYGSYASAVSFDLSAGAGATTGIGGIWSGVTSVIGSGNVDTIKGNNQTYALTGAGIGNNGAVNWTSFEQIADSGTGTISTTGGQSYTLTGANAGTVATLLPGGFTGIGTLDDAAGTIHFGTNGSLSGNVTAATLDYGSYASAVSFDLSAGNGATTGIGGIWSGVTSVVGSGNVDTIKGNNQAYALTGVDTGNNGTVGWTSFENIADNGSGTIVASNQNWTLTGNNRGMVTTLSGSFTGIGSLVDTGTGHFTMHSGADGSLSGSLDAGTGGTLDYTGYTTPVNVNLAGTGSTGIAGNLAGISTILADSNLGVSGTANGSLAVTNTGAGNTTQLGALAVGNGLTVNASGAVLQGSGPLTVGGTTSILAGGNAITLGNANNDFTGSVTVAGTGITLADQNDLNIASLTNSGNGNVSLTAGGALFGVGAINAGTGNITLAANGGALNTAALTGGDITLTGAGGIVLGSNVTAGGALSLTSGNTISQNVGTVITAASLTGSSVGTTILEGNNAIGSLGDFTAAGFSLTSGQALTVTAGATIDGGVGTTLTTTGAGSDLTINGTVQGTTTELTSSGAIAEGSGGIIDATTLTGSSAGDTTLAGANQIGTLAQFSAVNFSLVNAAALTVQGPLVTTGNISLTTTGPGNVLSVGQALTGGMISLDSAGDLSVVQAIQGTTINLTANGNLAIDAAVNSGSGVTTLVQNGAAGTISQSSTGTITAGTLTGAAQGSVALTGANAIANLGDFTADGFSLTNAGALTVAAGSTLDGGDSTALKTGGDLTLNGNVQGTLTSLVSSGAINEGSQGAVTAGILTGSAAHGVQLTGSNTVNNLGNFKANGLALTNGQALTVMAGTTVDGGANTALTVTGPNGNLTINGTLKGTTTTLNVSGAISEGAQGVLQAGTLTGSSVGSTTLDGNNDVDNLGNFTAAGFSLTTDPGLTVVAGSTVDGGASTTLETTGAGNDLTIDGTVKGGLVTLISSGAIAEGANGLVQANSLTGSSVGDTKLTQTEIDALNAFKAKNFYLTNAKALAVGGPVTTTGNAGDISLATTGNGNALTVNQAVQGAAVTLASAGDLTVANAVTGTKVDLAANGNLVIDAAVDSGAGTTTLTQTGNGTITGGANGSITAASLAGSATGTTMLGSAGQFMGNHVDVLGGFSSPAGFSLTNDGTLTLASVNGSAYTVDAGKSDLYLAVRNGDLLQNGSTWLYDGTGTWSATGHIGLANAPIYVTGTSPQVIAAIGLPPAYFYAVDYSGNLLPLTGATSVNVPTSILSSRSQGVNGHSDQYIDVGVITATYRAYGVVPPGLLLPADQRQCSPDQPSPECPDNN